jgi:hypothetical protein
MNTEPQNTSPSGSPAESPTAGGGQPQPTPAFVPSDPSAVLPPAAPEVPPRPKGKIASLPKAVRDRLNRMLADGLTYRQIIQELGPDAKNINEPNLSDWFRGPYQHWRKQQEELEAERAKWEFAADLVGGEDTRNITHATVQIAAKQLFQALNGLGPSSLGSLLQKEPGEYVRLINAVSRLSRDSLNFEKYRDACAQARVEVAKLRDPCRPFTQAETLTVVDKIDQILGLK